MNIVARGWLVWELTGSAMKLGVVSFAFGLPVLLFSFFGGAIADRVPKRNMLVVTQLCHAGVTLVIAVLVTTGLIEFWHLVMAGAATGVFFVFDGPARMSIIPELVPTRQLLNAISLNASGTNLTRVAAPTVAGALLVVIGTAGVFYTVVALYVAAAASLWMISIARRQELARTPLPQMAGPRERVVVLARSIGADLREGARYIRHSSLVLSLLAMAFVPLVFGLPYQNLLPVFADDVLGVGEFGYGTLMGAAGLGSLVASLVLAPLGDFRRKGVLLILLAATFGAGLVIFGLSGSYVLSLVVLLVVGAGGTGYMTLNNTLLQMNVPIRVLGRVMSLYMMTFALMPMGTLPIGTLGDAIGVSTAVTAGAVLVVVFVVVMAIVRPSIRRLE
ncbi:MAG: MFS transporter [Chloroflexota bacterium]|nr:MFS transporter [Chloroflexota bacterium]